MHGMEANDPQPALLQTRSAQHSLKALLTHYKMGGAGSDQLSSMIWLQTSAACLFISVLWVISYNHCYFSVHSTCTHHREKEIPWCLDILLAVQRLLDDTSPIIVGS